MASDGTNPRRPERDGFGPVGDDRRDVPPAFIYSARDFHLNNAGGELTQPGVAAGARTLPEENEWQAACRHWVNYALPGGPLTADLNSHEAAELSATMLRGIKMAWRAARECDPWSDEHDSAADMVFGLESTYHDICAETIISGLRHASESTDEFRQRAGLEQPRLPDTGLFHRIARQVTRQASISHSPELEAEL
jgi:hypothetical protein